MENKELNSRDIAGYLPYDFYVIEQGSVSRVIEYHHKTRLRVKWLKTGITTHTGLKYIKPVLRPLSDLYRTIVHNGEEITPIVNLAKMAYPDYDWKINKKMAVRDIIHEERTEKEWTERVLFGYTGAHTYFAKTEKNYRYFYAVHCYDNIEYIPDQVQLFDYLHELKIDYRGLIDAGLAIDCNTLEINPYK